jgi:hypothetical protein
MKRVFQILSSALSVGVAVVLLSTACSGNNKSTSTPGNTTQVQSPLCTQLQNTVNSDLAAVNTCSQDSDCTQTPVFRLNDSCNDLTYNASSDTNQLTTAVDNYNESCPSLDPTMVCTGICTQITCSSGKCTGGC